MKLKVNDNCLLCSWCSQACPVGATYFDGDKIAIDHKICISCGKCIDACNVGAIYDAENPPKPAAHHEPVQLHCDALILGGGAAGLVAAVKIAELTGKKVIVLEKAKKTGSGAPYAFGMVVFDSKWEKDAGIPIKVDQYIKGAMNTTRWELNPGLVANTYHAIPRFFDWLCEWGHPEQTFFLRPSPFDKTKLAVSAESHVNGAGKFIISAFTRRCEELGVSILREYTARDFIRNKDGHINSVVASDPGGETIIHFKNCLVATGSLINSNIVHRMVPNYADAFTRRYAHRSPFLTGDGVEMAERAGIPIDYNSICIKYIGIWTLPIDGQSVDFGKPIPSDLVTHINRGESLRVNMNGQRWINEAYSGEKAWVLLKQPQCVSWTVLDHKILNMKPLPPALTLVDPSKGGGIRNTVLDPGQKPDPSTVVMTMNIPGQYGNKPVDMKTLRYFADLPGKHLIIAETLEKLAEGMGVPVDAFMTTVKRYNEMCDKGIDEEYCKDKEHLLPIKEGPFYAFHTFLGNDGAFGGLAINEKMQILGKESPIPGLYAAGDNTSGRFINVGGEKYQIVNDMTWAVISGFLAGESIAKELGNKD